MQEPNDNPKITISIFPADNPSAAESSARPRFRYISPAAQAAQPALIEAWSILKNNRVARLY